MIRVLLADDQTMLRSSLSTLIDAESDLTVVGEAGDGVDAIRLAEQERPEGVGMDIRMPRLDGLAATREICGNPTLAATAVLVVTMFELEEYVYEALRAGAAGFLLKDAPPQQLVDGIRAVHAGESLLAPSVLARVVSHYVGTARPAPGAPDISELTPREREVLVLVAQGYSNAQIEDHLHIARATAKTHMSALLRKTGSRDRAQLVIVAYENGVVGRVL